jgi:hypothetical protein
MSDLPRIVELSGHSANIAELCPWEIARSRRRGERFSTCAETKPLADAHERVTGK